MHDSSASVHEKENGTQPQEKVQDSSQTRRTMAEEGLEEGLQVHTRVSPTTPHLPLLWRIVIVPGQELRLREEQSITLEM